MIFEPKNQAEMSEVFRTRLVELTNHYRLWIKDFFTVGPYEKDLRNHFCVSLLDSHFLISPCFCVNSTSFYLVLDLTENNIPPPSKHLKKRYCFPESWWELSQQLNLGDLESMIRDRIIRSERKGKCCNEKMGPILFKV